MSVLLELNDTLDLLRENPVITDGAGVTLSDLPTTAQEREAAQLAQPSEGQRGDYTPFLQGRVIHTPPETVLVRRPQVETKIPSATAAVHPVVLERTSG